MSARDDVEVTRREAEQLLGYAPGSLKAPMQQQHDRWPAPTRPASKGGEAHRYSLAQLREAAGRSPDAAESVGRQVTLPDTATAMQCLSCGRWLRSLGPHLVRAHGLTAEEYRAEHGLPRGAALMAATTRAALHQVGVERLAHDERVRQALAADADQQRARLAQARAVRGYSDQHPLVRQHRRDARAIAHAQQRAQLAARRDELARQAGYADWPTAIRATAELSERAAAAHLGVGRSTVRRWRAHVAAN